MVSRPMARSSSSTSKPAARQRFGLRGLVVAKGVWFETCELPLLHQKIAWRNIASASWPRTRGVRSLFIPVLRLVHAMLRRSKTSPPGIDGAPPGGSDRTGVMGERKGRSVMGRLRGRLGEHNRRPRPVGRVLARSGVATIAKLGLPAGRPCQAAGARRCPRTPSP